MGVGRGRGGDASAGAGPRPEHAPLRARLEAGRAGGLARCANHCCEPNCYTRIVKVGGKPRIALYSKRAIEAGGAAASRRRAERVGWRLQGVRG